MENGYLTIAEAARRLGCGLKWVYDLVKAGQLQAGKHDGLWWVSAGSVEARRQTLLKRREVQLKQRGA